MGLIKWGMDGLKKFNMWDVSVLKIYLVLIGTLIGAYFANFFIQNVWTVVAIIVLALIWLLYRMFK
ncbi:hypothetical protein GOV09_00665 [Candidatus Woesearchaeota archaeon]|nr:hypothetical protein [Candidatus Woesearchaeota archaeon]